MTKYLNSWAYLYGQPEITGQLRTQESDFKVFEQLPFELTGEGEHLYIYIRKTGTNTVYVARELAKYFEVKESLVAYAGLKDRFAVTEQWFAVHLPGKQSYDLQNLEIDGVEVLHWQRHNKKLRTGALSGNRFVITLRNVSDVKQLQQRWQLAITHGVPNYFGEQRFGIEGNNIAMAKTMFAGKRVRDKKKRSMYLSAARSLIFNQCVSARVEQNTFEAPQLGDVMMLAGTQSIFVPESIDAEIEQRFGEHDIDITCPMWGRGQLKTTEDVLALEQAIAHENTELCDGLERAGLKQERRRARLLVANATLAVLEDNTSVELAFDLPAGCFATTLLRELLDYDDLTQRQENARSREES
ncbi:tRNA pseudouridine(13) synthase TruD [Thalassotalea fusca]